MFLFYHRSIQATIENNDVNYIVSLFTHSLWNNSKCSIGNIYIPQKKHYLQHKLAKAEVLTWLSLHTSYPSLLIGDFNTPLEKFQNLISNFDDTWLKLMFIVSLGIVVLVNSFILLLLIVG